MGLSERVPCQVVLVASLPRSVKVILISITSFTSVSVLVAVPVSSLSYKWRSANDRPADARCPLIDFHVVTALRIILIFAAVVI